MFSTEYVIHFSLGATSPTSGEHPTQGVSLDQIILSSAMRRYICAGTPAEHPQKQRYKSLQKLGLRTIPRRTLAQQACEEQA